jgi:fructose-1,6-bisphosphatase/inositol monophosphatase family enzyme
MDIAQGKIGKIALVALEKAYDVHQELGVRGEELLQKNQFGDTALKADVEIEKAIINFFIENNIPLRIISEEHGTIDLCKDPVFLAILDGLDGSEVYKKSRGKGRYGTMLGIFSNIDPKYDDYRRFFYAMRGNGSFVVAGNKRIPIRSSNCLTLDNRTRIYVDEYFDFNKKTFSSKLKGFNVNCLGSSSMHYVDLASGNVDLVLECTRKNNLENAIAYGLEEESGAVMVDLEGVSIGPKRYSEFGQDKYIPVISAATSDLARRIIHHIR